MRRKGSHDKKLMPRNAAIYKAYVCGEEGESLAKQYSMTKSRVSQIVIEMEGRFLENEDAFIFAEKRRHTILLQDVYDKARRSYLRSLEDAKTTKVSGIKGHKDGRAEKTTKGQAGEASFLREMRGALADIRKIWGMDAPVKTDNTHEFGGGLLKITERVVVVKVVGKKSGSGGRMAHQGNGSNGNGR